MIISMAELSRYFGRRSLPAKMKEQIMTLLDEWKEKQPPGWQSRRKRTSSKGNRAPLRTLCPEVRAPRLGWASAVIYPPSPGTFSYSRERAVKGRNARRLRRLAPYGLPPVLFPQGGGGHISSRAAPFPG